MSWLPEVPAPERNLATELTKEDPRRAYDTNIHRLIVSCTGKCMICLAESPS